MPLSYEFWFVIFWIINCAVIIVWLLAYCNLLHVKAAGIPVSQLEAEIRTILGLQLQGDEIVFKPNVDNEIVFSEDERRRYIFAYI